jgi:hypothetical protein
VQLALEEPREFFQQSLGLEGLVGTDRIVPLQEGTFILGSL